MGSICLLGEIKAPAVFRILKFLYTHRVPLEHEMKVRLRHHQDLRLTRMGISHLPSKNYTPNTNLDVLLMKLEHFLNISQ